MLSRSADLTSQIFPTRSWIEVLEPAVTASAHVPLHHVAALAAWSVVFGSSPGSATAATKASGSRDGAHQIERSSSSTSAR